MGPYCKFCDQRCFIHLPDSTPEHIRAAYCPNGPRALIIATCPRGQAYEREKVGYCLADIETWNAARRGAEADQVGELVEPSGFGGPT